MKKTMAIVGVVLGLMAGGRKVGLARFVRSSAGYRGC